MSTREIVIRIQLPRAPRKRWLVGGGALVMLVGAIAYAAVTWPASHPTGTKLSGLDLDGYLNDLNNRSWQGSPTSRYFNGGNVGIGTTTPGQPLDVEAAANVVIQARSTTSGAAALNLDRAVTSHSAQVSFLTAGTSDFSMGTLQGGGGSDFGILNSGLSSTALTILKSNNNVGVGTKSPAEALDVLGNVSLFGGNRTMVLAVTSAGGALPCNSACGNISGACLAAFPDVAGAGATTCADNTQNHVCLCATHPRQ